MPDNWICTRTSAATCLTWRCATARASLHQLTHTAGFDERFAGAYTDAATWFRWRSTCGSAADQVIRPGRAYSYSNYNYALAGLVIEALSGLAF